MIEILYLFLEVAAVLLLLHSLYESKLRIKIWTLLYVLIHIGTIVLIGVLELPNMGTFFVNVFLALYCVKVFNSPWKEVLINLTLCILIGAVLQFLFAIIIQFIFGNFVSVTSQYCLVNLLLFLGGFLLYRYGKLYRISISMLRNNGLIRCALGIDFIFVLYCLFSIKRDEFVAVGKSLLILGVAMIFLLLAWELGRYIAKNKRLETEKHMQALYQESFLGLITEIRMKQHEFDNHLHVMKSLGYTCNTYEELLRELDGYGNSIIKENKFNKLLSNGNPAVLGFLYYKFQEIEKQGFTVKYKVSFTQLSGKVPVFTLVEIIGNLLDNAKEAMEKEKKKNLFFYMVEKEECIQVEIANESPVISYEKIQSFFQKDFTSKGPKRGLGLYHVKKDCQEHKIDLLCENKEMFGENYLSFGLVIRK